MKRVLKWQSQTPILFAILALSFGLTYVFLTPPLWGIDETSHFARVYQLAHGQILPHVDSTNPGVLLPKSLVDMNDYVKQDLLDNKNIGFLRKDVDSTRVYEKLNSTPFSREKANYLWTASYSPIAYIGPVIGTILADIFSSPMGYTIYVARIFSLLVYIFLIMLALRLLSHLKLRWLWLVVALTPVELFQASVITADSMSIGLSLLLVALYVRLLLSKKPDLDKYLVKWLIIVGALLPLVKINYIFLSFIVLLLPRIYFKNIKTMIATKGGSIAVFAILGALWTKITTGTAATASASVSQRPDGLLVDPGGQVTWILHHPAGLLSVGFKTLIKNADSYMHHMYTQVAWNYVTLPIVFIILLVLGTFICTFYAKDELRGLGKQTVLLNMLGAVGAVSIFLALYITFNPVGYKNIDGVQGRYFIPFLVPFMLLMGIVVPVEVRIKKNLAPYLFSTIVVVCLSASVLYYIAATYL